jgi:hypothetical protein
VLARTSSVAVSGAGLGLVRAGSLLSTLASWTTFLALPGHIGVRWQNVRFGALCSSGLSLGASVDAALVREWAALWALILVVPVTSSERRLAYPNLSFD